MTTELGPASRALLDAARGGLGPDPTAVARMRGRIDATVTGAAAPVGASIAGGKLGLVGLIAIALGVGGAAVTQRGDVADEPLVAMIDAEAPAATVRTVREPAPLETDLIEIETPKPRAPEGAPTRSERIVHTAAAGVSPVKRGVDLKREVELVDQAMTALRGGNANAALVATRLHAKETAGTGQLAEDIAAIEIEALCKLHDPAAPGRLTAFDARWPASAQRSRLSTSCR
jgi:hypothetical protein